MRNHIPLNRSLLLSLALLVAACDSPTGDGAAPQGLTEGERDRLEAAAKRLDARAQAPGADDAAALEAETRERLAAEQAQQSAAQR